MLIITRPDNLAGDTQTCLRQAGYETLKIPVAHPVWLPIDPQKLIHAENVIVTSQQALYGLLAICPTDILDLLKTRPLYAVGEKTARLAEKNGWQHIIYPPHAHYQELLILLKNNASYLYLAGKNRKPDFEQAMQAQKISYETIDVYDILPVGDIFTPTHQEICKQYRPHLQFLCFSGQIFDILSHYLHTHPNPTMQEFACPPTKWHIVTHRMIKTPPDRQYHFYKSPDLLYEYFIKKTPLKNG